MLENITIEQYTAANFGNPEPEIYLNDNEERCEFFTLYIKFKHNSKEYTAQADVDFDVADQPCFDQSYIIRNSDGEEVELPRYDRDSEDNKEVIDLFTLVENFIIENTDDWLEEYEVKAAK